MDNRNSPNLQANIRNFIFPVVAVLLTALAAGTGWGIRGQFGHETGAMIAGALASLTLVMLFVPQATSLAGARAAAMMTVAIGVGGSMTYGQTIGLTHDKELHGHWEAFRWGMAGLFMKGSIWIGFGGVFLGMGLGGKRYSVLEILALVLGMVGMMFLGISLINSPFEPTTKTLPAIYFSDSWYFEPGADLKPRSEMWGGLLVALWGLIAYVRFLRGDRLAARMALVGVISGGLGFPLAQAVQASHAWNPELYSTGALSWSYDFTQHFNWWNMMETTFGAIWGGGLALGLWFNRHLITVDTPRGTHDTTDVVTLSPTVEVLLCVTHTILLLTAEFGSLPGRVELFMLYSEFGLVMIALPLVGIVGGRYWPYLLLLPMVIAPVAGKTLRLVSYSMDSVPVGIGWFVFLAIPLAITLVVATWLIGRSIQEQRAGLFSAIALVVTGWLFYSLNTAVFDYAWPWKEWTHRTPNQLIFTVSITALTLTALCCQPSITSSNKQKGERTNH